jgi:hypothetical protein
LAKGGNSGISVCAVELGQFLPPVQSLGRNADGFGRFIHSAAFEQGNNRLLHLPSEF